MTNMPVDDSFVDEIKLPQTPANGTDPLVDKLRAEAAGEQFDPAGRDADAPIAPTTSTSKWRAVGESLAADLIRKSVVTLGTLNRLGWLAFAKSTVVGKHVVSEVGRVVYEEFKRPVAEVPAPEPPRLRTWDLSIRDSGKKGDVHELSVRPESPFQVEKIMATDGHGGRGTAIKSFVIGDVPQMPLNTGGTLTLFYATTALGNSKVCDWCEIGQSIRVVVEYFEDSDFEMIFFGSKR